MTETYAPVPWLVQLQPPDGTANGEAPEGAQAPRQPDTTGALPDDTLGLALSGGGVRSASFCLGVLQALARADWLRRVDYLSTVSGGGYIGAFLGRAFDVCRKPGGTMSPVLEQRTGAAQEDVARELIDPRSQPNRWLRHHANYLSPTGVGEALFNVAAFWRNFLSLQFVIATFFFMLFGVANAFSYGPWESALGELVSPLAPLAGRLTSTWSSPWLTATELSFWLAVIPLMLAYWVISQEEHESFVWPVLLVVTLLVIAALIATFSPLSVAVLAATIFWALEAWHSIRTEEGRGDPQSRFRMALGRNHLTYRLAFWVAVTVALASLALIDGLGQWLAREMFAGGLTVGNVARWFGGITAMLLALAPVLRLVARFFATRDGDPSSLVSILVKIPLLSTVAVLAFGALLPLAAVAFLSHAAYGLGYEWGRGLIATGVALVVSLVLGRRECLQFVNRSGALVIYAARLSRTFLGAVNPMRRRYSDEEGRDVTRVMPGDDLPFDEYQPHLAGGPLHIINCAVNETIDVASQRGQRDRQAENMAVGPAGVSVAQRWHALWRAGMPDDSVRYRRRFARRRNGPLLEPVDAGSGPHPFLAKDGRPVNAERLNLRIWTAISGASVSPGLGRLTSIGYSLLLTLANLRLGYWWYSGMSVSWRRRVPTKGGLWEWVERQFFRLFQAQWLLLCELRGRFGGPWHRYWYLSDGGNFELSGAYELLRRRVPFVILCDASHDPKHHGSTLAALVRLALVDFGAQIDEVRADPDTSLAVKLQGSGVPPEIARRLGSLSDLMPEGKGLPTRHAALLSVRYPEPQGNGEVHPWNGRRHTWLLYLKATVNGDEGTDLKNYRLVHPDFPNEPTLDQFFDEAQWESYRKLGEHIGDELFTSGPVQENAPGEATEP